MPDFCNVTAEYTFEICNESTDAPLDLDEEDTVLTVDGTEVTFAVTPPLFVTNIEPEQCSEHKYEKEINLCGLGGTVGAGVVNFNYNITMDVAGEEMCVESGKGGKSGKSCSKGKGGKGKGGKGKGGKGKGSDSKGGKGKGGKSSKSKGGSNSKGGKSSKSKGNSKGYSRNLKSSKGKATFFECKLKLSVHVI